MKKYIDHLLNTIGLCLSYLPLSILTKSLHSCRDKIYSGYLRRKFAHMGNSFFLWHPHTLIGTEFIHIGDGCTFESGLQLSAWASEGKAPRIVIGNHCLIRSNAHITASNCITIGNNLLTVPMSLSQIILMGKQIVFYQKFPLESGNYIAKEQYALVTMFGLATMYVSCQESQLAMELLSERIALSLTTFPIIALPPGFLQKK